MKKTAQFASVWPQVYQKILNPPPTIIQNLQNYPNIQKLKGILPQYPMAKFKVNPTRLQAEPMAVGHVTTEDVDGDGKIDTINLNSPRIEEEFSKSNVPLGSFMSLTEEQLGQVLEPISGLILHEIGHLGGKPYVMYDPENPEATFRSEQEAESFVPAATNIQNKFDKTGSFNMSLRTLEVLADLATKLDKKGNNKVADFVDKMIEKYSQDLAAEEDPELTRLTDELSREHQGRLERWKSQQPGKIRPKGDPFTYNFDPASKVFTVATVPSLDLENSIGQPIRPGDSGYDLLKAEAVRMGLMQDDAAPVAAPERSGYPAYNPEAKYEYKDMTAPEGSEFIMSQKRDTPHGAGAVTPEAAERSAMLYEKNTRELMPALLSALRSGTTQGSGTTAESLVGDPEKARVLYHDDPAGRTERVKRWLDQVKRNQPAKYRMYVDEAKIMKLLEEVNAENQKALDAWARYEELSGGQRPENSFGHFPIEGMADDGAVTASEDEDTLSKIASLKDEYQKIFWFDSNSPFNRSNTKFKR